MGPREFAVRARDAPQGRQRGGPRDDQPDRYCTVMGRFRETLTCSRTRRICHFLHIRSIQKDTESSSCGSSVISAAVRSFHHGLYLGPPFGLGAYYSMGNTLSTRNTELLVINSKVASR